MAAERTTIFGEDDASFDLSDFKPTRDRARVEKRDVLDAAAKAGFTSREGRGGETTDTSQARRSPRRRVTGRNRQLNLKVTSGALDRFYALADQEGLVLGEAFERALAAWEASLASS